MSVFHLGERTTAVIFSPGARASGGERAAVLPSTRGENEGQFRDAPPPRRRNRRVTGAPGDRRGLRSADRRECRRVAGGAGAVWRPPGALGNRLPRL